VPGVITGPPCSWGILIRGTGPPGWESVQSATAKRDDGSAGLGPENKTAGEDQQQLYDSSILSSERMLLKGYDRKFSVEKNTDSESQGLVANMN
jgi:hypothetical protein